MVVGAYYELPHVHTRVVVWLHPFAYPDTGYQMQQSLFSFGTGGIFGTGLGTGHPDLVPLARTDFIVAAFAEETGLLGITAVILVYLLIVSRGLRIAQLTRDSFGPLASRSPSRCRSSSSSVASATSYPKQGSLPHCCPTAGPR